jgi:hypothetical protein
LCVARNLQQQLDDVDVALRAGPVQRRAVPHAVVLQVGVGAVLRGAGLKADSAVKERGRGDLQQQPHNVSVARVGSDLQRGATVAA